jgi:iron complex outermembrane receptor protein
MNRIAPVGFLGIAVVLVGAVQTEAATPAAGAGDADGTGQTAAPVNEISEIVVTAQRRSEPLQSVPVSVTAATGAQLQSVGISTTQDLNLVTPGLTVPQVAGYTQPHIRGVGSSTNGPGLEQPVATYIDGVYLGFAPASLLTLNNIDRVEVLKGPQGTLFGRNATGGLIQVVTKDPSQSFSGAANATYANYQDTVGDLYVTGGLTRALAADAAVRYEHQNEAWGTNLATGSPIGQLNHDFAGRTKFLLQASDSTTIRLALDYEDKVSSRDVQHLGRQYPGTFDNPFFGGPYPMGGPFDINNNINPANTLQSGGAAVQINQDFAHFSLQSISAYRTSRANLLLDTDATPADILEIAGIASNEQFTQELQLASSSPGPLNWVSGLYYYHAIDQWEPLDINFGPSIVSPVAGVPVTIDERDGEHTNSIAAYAQGAYRIFSDTHLTVGARFTHEKRNIEGNFAFIVAGTPVATTPIPPPNSGIPASLDFNRLTYRIALDHQFTPVVLGYISYNTGFKSGGYNLAVPSNPPYSPETIGAAEVGLKTEFFDRRLRVNGAAYDYSYKNIQVGRYVDGNESIYNGASAKIYGADLDAEAILFGGFSITGGFSYTHARFDSFPLADYVVPVNGCVPPPGGVCPAPADGKHLPFAPTATLNIGGDYKLTSALGSFELNVTYYRSDRFFAAPDNVAYQPSYDLVNASATWSDTTDRYLVKLWGKNLGKTIYATSLIEAGQGEEVSLGAPRTYGVTVGVKF